MDSTQLMQKVAEVAPKEYGFLVESAEEVKTSPFHGEITEELDHIIKTAAFNAGAMASRLGGGAAQLGMGVAATALGGVALSLAGDATDALRRGLTKTRNYKRMLAANPDLKEKPAYQVQSIFSTLHRFNPDFSGDPVVAGSFVRNHVDLVVPEGAAGAVGLDSMKSIVDARKGLLESRRFPQLSKFDGGKKEDPEMMALQKRKLTAEVGKLEGGGRNF